MENNQTKKGTAGSIILLVFALLYSVFQLVGFVMVSKSFYFDLAWLIECIVAIAMSLFLFISYRNHTKNVMKPLLGASLLLLLFVNIESASFYLQNLTDIPNVFSTSPVIAVYAIVNILLLFVLIAINVMHYLINASHYSSPKKVMTNRMFFIAALILFVLKCMCFLLVYESALAIVGSCLSTIADVFYLCIIIRIENSMDEFRMNREAAGWTQENGLPKE